jgi:FKBP-type peptidyl-prolyl cis-trans isomerase SlyD
MMTTMLIHAPCVVSLRWRLEDAQGELIDELAEAIEFFYGGEDLLARVEEVLADQGVGFASRVKLEPDQAFGQYDAELVFFEARDIFPAEIAPGMQFDGPPPGAQTPDLRRDAIYTVTEVYDEHVVLDGNHPLAGIALVLDLSVDAVREATPEELERRSVDHGEFTVLSKPPSGTAFH